MARPLGGGLIFLGNNANVGDRNPFELKPAIKLDEMSGQTISGQYEDVLFLLATLAFNRQLSVRPGFNQSLFKLSSWIVVNPKRNSAA